MDIRQSQQYANHMRSLGWKVERVGKWNAFIKSFPFIGSFIKIQRIDNPIPWKEIEELQKKHRAFRMVIEPDLNTKLEIRNLKLEILNSPFSPTKTIHIDLAPTEETIFKRFKESTRRAVRRAQKNKVTIEQSNNIEEFIRLKTRSMFPVGYFMGRDIRKLWNAFRPKNAKVLFAYKTVVMVSNRNEKMSQSMKSLYFNSHYDDTYHRSGLLGGILLLFHEQTAYYWHAAATPEGKKLFAPTLLVWEALKLSKKRGCKTFNFEGIYDERFPDSFKKWRGFTKFKKGFGGTEIEYPEPFAIMSRS